MRHLADVAALRANPVQQRQVLIDGLAKIFDASIGWLCVADGWLPGRDVKLIHQVITSTSPPIFLSYMAEFAVTHSVLDDPIAYYTIHNADSEMVLTRADFLPDAASHVRFADCVALMKKMELVDGIVCGYRSGPDNGTLVGFSLHRGAGGKKINEPECRLARLAIQEIRRLAEQGHLVLRGHSEPQLSARLNQVLDRLLSGENPKAIAIALDASVWTIRDHIQALYKHFGVSGRDELMARFVGNSDRNG